MAKNKKVAEVNTEATESENIKVIADVDPNAITTEAEVVGIQKGSIDGEEVDVKVINTMPKIVIDSNAPLVWAKLRDGGSCWGVGPYFIANRQIVQIPDTQTTRIGVMDGAIILCDEKGNPL